MFHRARVTKKDIDEIKDFHELLGKVLQDITPGDDIYQAMDDEVKARDKKDDDKENKKLRRAFGGYYED